MKNIKNSKGAVSIPLVMGIGIILFLIVISITSVEVARIYVAQADVDGSGASEYAKSGVRDALQHIARDNTFGTTTVKYQIDMKDAGCEKIKYCVKVAVSPLQNSSSTGRVIGVIGYYKSAIKGIEAEVIYDSDSLGEIKINNTKETLKPFGL